MAKSKSTSRKSRSKTSSTRINKDLLWIGISAAILVLVGVAGIFLFGQSNNDTVVAQALPLEITVQEAEEMRASGALILDVRQPEEWDEVHIPGAMLIPLGELQSRIDEIPTGQEVVVYCRSGNRSQEGRDILLNNGFAQATSMGGGIRAWQSAGFETASGQ